MSESSTPPDHTKIAIPNIVLWGWLGAAVASVIALLAWVLALSFQVDHRIIEVDNKAGGAVSDAKQAHDLAAHDDSKIDDLEKRVRLVERYCLPRNP